MANIASNDLWQNRKLGDMAEEVRDLFEPRGAEEYPYVGLEHIEQGTLQLNGIGQSTDTVSTKKQFKRGEILFGSLRPYFRKVVRPKFNGVCSTDITVIRPKKNCSEGFLQYFIASHSFIDHATNISSGTRMPRANWKTLCESEWQFPLLPTQRKIAAILSAYDDLIENNLRRIKILEEMAQNLYREWFVKFRFPGHEKARFVDSALGRIPEGWEVSTLGEMATVVTKGTTPTTFGKDFKAEGINFFKVESVDQTGGIEENKLAKIDVETHEMLKRSQIKRGDILFSIAGAIGRTTIVPQRLLPANTNQALAIIRIPSDDNRTYIFHCVRADEFQHFSLGRVVQTAQANVSLGILKSAPIIMPPKGLLGEFARAASSLMQMQENIRSRNITLRRTRDLLLPKLISGEVDVSELDITVQEEAV